MFLLSGTIIEQTFLEEGYALLYVHVPKPLHISSGQFCMVQVPGQFLRRPLSVHYYQNQILSFYYQVKGKGTQGLSKLQKEDLVEIQGPLGHGFLEDIPAQKVLIISGGVGIAPMKLLMERLLNHHCSITFISAFSVARGTNILSAFGFEGIDHHLITDDGSLGIKSNPVDYLEQILKTQQFQQAYICGPSGMMQKCAQILTKYNIPAQLSLESHFACGVGACLGCSVATKEGSKLICIQGPVFNSHIIEG